MTYGGLHPIDFHFMLSKSQLELSPVYFDRLKLKYSFDFSLIKSTVQMVCK
jgi:hypothetical protein